MRISLYKGAGGQCASVYTVRHNANVSPQAERIADLSSFIFSEKKGDHKRFYRFIARDIQRPLFAVYRKMLRVFDVSNHVGRWSRENEEKLLRYI